MYGVDDIDEYVISKYDLEHPEQFVKNLLFPILIKELINYLESIENFEEAELLKTSIKVSKSSKFIVSEMDLIDACKGGQISIEETINIFVRELGVTEEYAVSVLGKVGLRKENYLNHKRWSDPENSMILIREKENGRNNPVFFKMKSLERGYDLDKYTFLYDIDVSNDVVRYLFWIKRNSIDARVWVNTIYEFEALKLSISGEDTEYGADLDKVKPGISLERLFYILSNPNTKQLKMELKQLFDGLSSRSKLPKKGGL